MFDDTCRSPGRDCEDWVDHEELRRQEGPGPLILPPTNADQRRTGRLLSRQFGGDPTEWMVGVQDGAELVRVIEDWQMRLFTLGKVLCREPPCRPAPGLCSALDL